MQLFPGRTLEELDGLDEGRLYAALEARSIGRDCRVVDGYLKGSSTPRQFAAVDPDIAREFMKWQREKNGSP